MFLGWAMLVITVVITLLTAPAHAAAPDPLVLTGPADIAALSRHLEYTIDSDWQLKVGDLLGPSPVEMRAVRGPVPDFGYTSAKIWLRLRIVNETTQVNDWRLFLHVAFTQQVAVYRIGSTGEVTTLLDLKEDSPFSDRPISYPQIVAPFDLRPGEAATLVVAYYSMGASRHSMSIETPDSFAQKAGINTAKNYAFYGMMVVMIVLAILALFTLWESVFAAYAAYLFASFLYVAHADGMAFQLLWPAFPQFNSMAASVAGSAVMVFASLFAISFLRTARYHPVMHRVLLTVVASVLALDVVLWLVDPKLLNRLLVYMSLVSVLTWLVAGLVAARTRFREVRFYVFAWTASLIPACLFTARFAFGIEPTFITLYDAIRLALILDALMMGLAIFDRYSHLRQSAMEESLAQAKVNLTLSQRLAALEESYQLVTANMRERAESVNDTAHDLRQPMHALRLSLRQMFSDGTQTTAEDVAQIESALGYMEKLVTGWQVNHAEAGEAAGIAAASDIGDPPICDEPGLHDVLRGVTDMFAAEAAAKGLTVRLVLAAPDSAVAAYPLMRAVANLVSNAIKYTGQGRILIGLRLSAAGYRVEVHDTGPGLRGEAFEQALSRHRRLERDRFAADGTGLGLAVVKETVELNNWRLSSCAHRRDGASIRIDIPAALHMMTPSRDGARFSVAPSPPGEAEFQRHP